ncbi:MAG: DUF4440 domain-containing protein [Terriglobia bacterium]|nr:MAG: DUF4440 domain-containing protein [Terriglobia bacterium]
MSTATVTTAAQAVRALEAQFERLANANDAAGITSTFYADNARLLPPNAPMVEGHAAILDFWKAFLAAGQSDVRLETADVIASGDLAYSIGNYGHTTGGVRHTGKYVVVYQRQADGGYKAVADSFNSNE